MTVQERPDPHAPPEGVPETTTYLEMLDRGELRSVPAPDDRLELKQVRGKDALIGRTLYQDVGADWLWIDRLNWSEAAWHEYYARPDIELWVGYLGPDVVGYFELAADGKGNTELAYFGLRPQFIGRKFGGWLLAASIERAWESGARRVWVHTSSRDHEYALANYVSRGFKVYKSETKLAPTTNPSQ